MADDDPAGVAKGTLIAASTIARIEERMSDTGMLIDPVKFDAPTANRVPQK
jgi:hypothetical protein